MLSRKEKRLMKEAMEAHAMVENRKSFEEGPSGDEHFAPWMIEKMATRSRPFDEKLMFEAFSFGLTRAYCGEFPPENFQEVLKKIAGEIKMMKLSRGDKTLQISIKEIVDKHFRIWIRESIEIQYWIKANEISSRAILAAAGDLLLGEFDVFDQKFKKMRPEYDEIVANAFTESAAVQSPNGSDSSDMLSKVI